MPKYIDADKIERFIRRDEWQTPDERWRPESEFGAFIDALPAEDVAQVVHAKWVGIEFDGYADGNPVYDVFECSNCGHEHYGEYDSLTEYCPDCGARMDEEEEEDEEE